MFKKIKVLSTMVVMSCGLDMYAGQNNKLNVINNSSMFIDVYVANKNSGHDTTVYNSNAGVDSKTNQSTDKDNKIQDILSKLSNVAPNNVAAIVYPQDPQGVVVRFYDPADTTKILKIISLPLTDKICQIIIEGNNGVGTNLTPWSTDAGADNTGKPVANSVTLFVGDGTTSKAVYYDQQNVPSTKITNVPAAK